MKRAMARHVVIARAIPAYFAADDGTDSDAFLLAEANV